MKEFLLLAALATQSGQPADYSRPATQLPTPQRTAWTCFSSGEQTSGRNKICYYDCNGSAAAITVGWAQICPMSINR